MRLISKLKDFPSGRFTKIARAQKHQNSFINIFSVIKAVYNNPVLFYSTDYPEWWNSYAAMALQIVL